MPYKHLIHFAFNKELSEIYVASVIKSFGIAMIGIFIPAYLINLNYPLNYIFAYYLFWVLSFLVLVVAIPHLYKKIGLKHAILFSMPIQVVYFLLLYGLGPYNGLASSLWKLFFVVSVGALANALYWPAFHINFIASSDKKHRGEELGMMNIFSYMVVIFSPLIGGLIITYFGFTPLFILVTILLLISPIPLFFSTETYPEVKFSIKNLFHKRNLRNFSVFFVEGIVNYTETVIWVIFIFITLKSFIALGMLATLLIICTTVLTFIIGRLSDVMDKRKIMRAGIFSTSIIWFLKTLADSFFLFTIVNTLFGIAFTFLSVPYMALFYNKAAKTHPAEFVIFREVALGLGRITILAFIMLSGSFIGSFIIAGFSSLIFSFF
ncbi:MAG: MFS transporter [Nanoarchaeota archaeon]|nr:MFS transporter [Nanoarchaeota archaeon]MCG2718228.1 MFS transporter [Nanoarchaeota archaeon]